MRIVNIPARPAIRSATSSCAPTEKVSANWRFAPIAAVPDLRQLASHHHPLAFIEVTALEVQRDDKRDRVHHRNESPTSAFLARQIGGETS
jgi:hypothetical protein